MYKRQYLHHADYIVMESTYGDRSHGEKPDYVKLLSEIIQETFDRGGPSPNDVSKIGNRLDKKKQNDKN